MVEITEVLRLWQAGVPKKRIAARLGLDPKTVRRYFRRGRGDWLRLSADAVSEKQLRDVLLALHPGGGRPRGTTGIAVTRSRRQFAAGSRTVSG